MSSESQWDDPQFGKQSGATWSESSFPAQGKTFYGYAPQGMQQQQAQMLQDRAFTSRQINVMLGVGISACLAVMVTMMVLLWKPPKSWTQHDKTNASIGALAASVAFVLLSGLALYRDFRGGSWVRDVVTMTVVAAIGVLVLGVGIWLITRNMGRCDSKNPSASCAGNRDGKNQCNADTGKCVQCVSDQDCVNNHRGNQCDTATNTCKCGDADSCSADKYCASVDGAYKCIQCRVDADCSYLTPNCNPDTNVCYGCEYGGDPYQCAPGFQCTENNTCAVNSCATAADCGPGQVCLDNGVGSPGTCSASTSFTSKHNVTLQTFPPPTEILSLNFGDSADSPLMCANLCAANDACYLYDWRNSSSGTSCTLYMSTEAATNSPLDSPSNFAVNPPGQTSWSGTRNNYAAVGTCYGTLPCVTQDSSITLLPNFRYTGTFSQSHASIPDVATCAETCGNIDDTNPYAVGQYDTTTGTCQCQTLAQEPTSSSFETDATKTFTSSVTKRVKSS